jgi:hypothetical protein
MIVATTCGGPIPQSQAAKATGAGIMGNAAVSIAIIASRFSSNMCQWA